jgi:hypothetical protein
MKERLELAPVPGAPKIDRVFLIDIEDTSPRRVIAHLKYIDVGRDIDHEPSDAEIIALFDAPENWTSITEPVVQVGVSAPAPGSVRTRLDLDITRPGKREFARVAFRVPRGDRFFDLDGAPVYAITGGEPGAGSILYQPQWIGSDSIVSMLVRGVATQADSFSTHYNLGIVVKDLAAEYHTPIFIDPKIEDSGG